jgi:hypothetical protein
MKQTPITPRASVDGTVQSPKFHDGDADTNGDERLSYRLYSYGRGADRVVGAQWSVMLELDRPAKDVWLNFKDWSRWQSQYGYNYSGVVGELYSDPDRDLGEETFHITFKMPDGTERDTTDYRVLMVIPERLVVVFQPVQPQGVVRWEDGSQGGMSPGFHVMMLNEHDGKTAISVLMEHSSRRPDLTDDEALDWWRPVAAEVHRFWRDIFIPNLKNIVYEGSTTS